MLDALLSQKARLGMFAFIASEAIFFVMLILTFVFYRNSPANAGGPTPFNSLDVGRTAIFSACLYASSLTIWLAARSHKRGRGMRWFGWLVLTILLGATFLYGEISEYSTMAGVDHVVPNSDVFASSFYALTGFHGFHVFVGLLLLTVLCGLTLRGKFKGGARRSAVQVISIYWHFVDALWVVIFPTVYLWSLAGPR